MIVKLFLLVLCIIFAGLLACKPSPKSSPELGNEDYQPKGDAADLVYNPIRADGSIDSSYLPIIEFTSQVFDFGEINEGDIIEHDFKFKNTGTAPLLIVESKSTCGCTIPEFSKDPIPPGGEGIVKVKFDSKNIEGAQNKEVSIFANTIPNKTVLRIKGIVAKTK